MGDNVSAGLCEDCRFARVIRSDRGSAYWRCDLSLSDPRFAKYPRLPVVTCSGHIRRAENASARSDGDAAGE